MKVAAAVIWLAVAVCVQGQQSGYSGRLANINIDAVLNNERILKSYLNCILHEKAPCTPEGREARKTLPEVYYTNCSKCSPEQKSLMKKTVKAFIAKRKPDWDAVVKKYDPERKHEKEFLEFVQEP